jgi:23S rRNA (pseudouridine1915-N3)-methyltransferase
MKLLLMAVGRTNIDFVRRGIDEYLKRLSHYLPVEVKIIPDLKRTAGLTEAKQKEQEGTAILSSLQVSDRVILLDEKGKEYTSEEFASFMEKQMASGVKRLVFVVGGPYGFSTDVYNRADGKLSLSRMTFNHEMVRMFFVEQLYRSQTILRGEPYHHS